MAMFAGSDVGVASGRRCALSTRPARVVWRGIVGTHPQMLAAALKRFDGKLRQGRAGERPVHAASFPLGFRRWAIRWCAWTRAGRPMRSRGRRIKSDKADAFALAEMLRTAWASPVHVKSAASHKIKTLLRRARPAGQGEARALPATTCAACCAPSA